MPILSFSPLGEIGNAIVQGQLAKEKIAQERAQTPVVEAEARRQLGNIQQLQDAQTALGGSRPPQSQPAPSSPFTTLAPAIGNTPVPWSPTYMARSAQAESSGNPSATTNVPGQTSAGLFGFTEPTWLGVMRKNPDLKLTPEGRIGDTAQNQRAMEAFTRDNATALSNAGVPVNDASLRLAHLLGADGAVSFIMKATENPSAPAASMVGPAGVKANYDLFFDKATRQPVSAQDFYNKTTAGFGPTAAPAAPARTIASGLAPDAAAAILMNPLVDPSVKQMIVSQLNPQYGFQTTADGTIVRTNPRTGAVEPVFQSAKPSFTKIGTDALGREQYGFVDVSNHTVRPAGTPGLNGTTAVPASGDRPTGEDYLKQFPAEVQSAVKDYIAGRAMPTGNPRQGTPMQIKMIAQTYGQDLGIPVDDTTFAARRDMRTQLSKGTPGSLGGQITFAGTSLGHLADVADKAVDLGNYSGFGVPGLAWLTNATRAGFSTDQAGKVNAVNGAVQHYGQEITKFYTGSPGGEAERMRFLKTIDAAKSPQELAGAIRTERDLIPDRLNQIHDQIADRLGKEEADKWLARARIDTVIPRINAALAKLDPTGPEAAGQIAARAALDQARAAIAAGADRGAVIQRLRENHIDPAGL